MVELPFGPWNQFIPVILVAPTFVVISINALLLVFPSLKSYARVMALALTALFVLTSAWYLDLINGIPDIAVAAFATLFALIGAFGENGGLVAMFKGDRLEPSAFVGSERRKREILSKW